MRHPFVIIFTLTDFLCFIGLMQSHFVFCLYEYINIYIYIYILFFFSPISSLIFWPRRGVYMSLKIFVLFSFLFVIFVFCLFVFVLLSP